MVIIWIIREFRDEPNGDLPSISPLIAWMEASPSEHIVPPARIDLTGRQGNWRRFSRLSATSGGPLPHEKRLQAVVDSRLTSSPAGGPLGTPCCPRLSRKYRMNHISTQPMDYELHWKVPSLLRKSGAVGHAISVDPVYRQLEPLRYSHTLLTAIIRILAPILIILSCFNLHQPQVACVFGRRSEPRRVHNRPLRAKLPLNQQGAVAGNRV